MSPCAQIKKCLSVRNESFGAFQKKKIQSSRIVAHNLRAVMSPAGGRMLQCGKSQQRKEKTFVFCLFSVILFYLYFFFFWLHQQQSLRLQLQARTFASGPGEERTCSFQGLPFPLTSPAALWRGFFWALPLLVCLCASARPLPPPGVRVLRHRGHRLSSLADAAVPRACTECDRMHKLQTAQDVFFLFIFFFFTSDV